MRNISGKTHIVRIIEFDHICDPQRLPLDCLERHKTPIGILRGQNSIMFFPGSDEDARCGNMRVRRSILGD